MTQLDFKNVNGDDLQEWTKNNVFEITSKTVRVVRQVTISGEYTEYYDYYGQYKISKKSPCDTSSVLDLSINGHIIEKDGSRFNIVKDSFGNEEIHLDYVPLDAIDSKIGIRIYTLQKGKKPTYIYDDFEVQTGRGYSFGVTTIII